MTTESRTPVDQAVELLVYAPVGLALAVRDVLPELIERGRSEVTTQVSSARVVGRYAVKLGRSEVTKALRNARAQAERTLGGGRTAPGASSPPRLSPAVSRPPAPEPAPSPAASRPPAPEPAPSPAANRPPAPVAGGNGSSPDPSALAIPGYDSLSASQVVSRLGGLGREELEAVRAYEASGRRRKTVLARVAQLQSAAGT